MVDYSKKYECGCRVVVEVDDSNYLRGEIDYCPTHAAAPEMKEALQHILVSESFSLQGGFDEPFDWIESINKVSAALELAKGDDND